MNATNESFNPENEAAYIVTEKIKTFYPPVLMIFGIFGNVLSILVLRKRTCSSTSLLLISLAVTDTFVLLNSVLKKWIFFMLNLEPRNSSAIFCKVDIFLSYVLIQLSPWILVLVTLERTYCVIWPQNVRDVFTKRRIAVALSALIMCLSAINSHLLFIYDLIFEERIRRVICYPRNETFVFKIWTWIDLALAFGIPFCALLTGNLTILIRILSSNKFRKSSVTCRTKRETSKSALQSKKPVSQWTVMTLILNTTFFVLICPSVTFGIGQVYWFPEEEASVASYAKMLLVSEIVFMLMYTNSAINFVLYMMFGSKFRADLKALLFPLKRFSKNKNKSRATIVLHTSSGSHVSNCHQSSTHHVTT
ncbi:FMRFamide receptor-like [Mya arenaria]|uniref:FMRFamide receptor-like n=1 Tax=Mya arenaria TaxID=6604 RepID=UPI0022E2321C|nr:FMRFamide receptor-like [Mya arenaria]